MALNGDKKAAFAGIEAAKMLFCWDSPEIPLQFFLLHKFRHNWAHQYFVDNRPNDEIPKYAHWA